MVVATGALVLACLFEAFAATLLDGCVRWLAQEVRRSRGEPEVDPQV